MQHTFLYISLPLVCLNTTWNVQNFCWRWDALPFAEQTFRFRFRKLLGYTFYGGNVVRVLVNFFFSLPRRPFSLLWPLAFLIFLTPIQNFVLFFEQKKCILCLLYLALAICHSFSRWASLACRQLSLFLCLSLSLYFKFLDLTINLSLIF